MSHEVDWWPAPAKINLFLHIVGRRADGLHLLQTVFQLLALGDRLRFELTQDGSIRRLSDLAGVAESQDIVVKAAHLLQQTTGCPQGAAIFVEKHLPMGGGLAGGSTDAATTLVALNHLWQTGLSTAELARLGLQLGADVPVFIHGHSAWAEGVGEDLTPVTLPRRWYLVVHPGINVNTAEIFRIEGLRRDCPPSTIRAFLDSGNRAEFVNVCQPHVAARYPAVAQALAALAEIAEATPMMTGTGACVFAEFGTEQAALAAKQQLPEAWEAWVSEGINQSPLLMI